MIQIFHNPKCSKSRNGLKYLTDNNIKFEIVDYLKEGITPQKIQELANKIDCQVTDLIRIHEDFYKKELKGKDIKEEEWFKIISENPRLLHRPIIVNGPKAVFAQPAEKVQEIL